MVDQRIVDSLRSAISFAEADPISMTREQRLGSVGLEAFFEAGDDATEEAIAALAGEGITPLQGDMLEFLENVRRLIADFEKKDFLRENFGDEREPQLANVQVETWRNLGKVGISRFTFKQLVAMTSGEMRDWALPWIGDLREQAPHSIVVYFTDDEKTSEHGFPFDFTMVDEKD